MFQSIKAAIKRAFGHDSLDWVDRLYFVDWAIVALIWVLSWFVSLVPVFQREFSLEDTGISHPHQENTVGSQFNHWVALMVPAAIFLFGGLLRESLLVVHHGVISLCAARGLARLITVSLKHTVGRLRPDFLSRCKWDNVMKACTGALSEIIEGRKSFPSGHSSTAFSGMTLLSLWLAGQTGALCFGAQCTSSPIRSRLASFFLTILPLFWAGYVAVTRIEDNRHFPDDVVVGSMIGVVSSMICYHVFWPSPFSPSNFNQDDKFGQPRLLYNPVIWVDRQIPVARLEEDDTENV